MRGRKAGEPTVPTMMRLPQTMRNLIDAEARANERSLTAEVIYRLKRDMEREGKRRRAS